MNLFVIVIIALSLSMDAFSLSLAYGTLNLEKKYMYKLAFIVGIYHFCMPLLGNYFGKQIFKIININDDILVFLVLLIIGVEMIFETFKTDNNVKVMHNFELLLFGFAVSIDSFSVGMGLSNVSNNIFFISLIFSLTSFLFTYIGLLMGKKINGLIGRLSTFFGGIMLILIGILFII